MSKHKGFKGFFDFLSGANEVAFYSSPLPPIEDAFRQIPKIPKPGEVIRPTRKIIQIPVEYWEELKAGHIILFTGARPVIDTLNEQPLVREGDRTFLIKTLSQFDPYKTV